MKTLLEDLESRFKHIKERALKKFPIGSFVWIQLFAGKKRLAVILVIWVTVAILENQLL